MEKIMEEESEMDQAYYLEEVNSRNRLLVGILENSIKQLEVLRENEGVLKDTLVTTKINWCENRINLSYNTKQILQDNI